MSKFEYSASTEGDSAVLTFSGHIDEEVNFSDVNPGEGASVIIDFDAVTAINSCGIREWIAWVKGVSGKTVVFRNCPKIIVDQINMVSGFVPENGKVESFYVPYYCDSTDNEKMILFSEGQEFNGSEVNPPEDIKDDESGEEMEMDVIEAKYFKFLQG